MRRGTSGIAALIAVDKPVGMTSHDVVDRVRRALGERRVGHAGTLDPDASGVLVVGVGQATRLMGLLTAERKSYVGLVAFGAETNTDDAAGVITRAATAPSCVADESYAREAVAALVGEREQVPPAFSAISVDGVRAYARARAKESVELPARRVTIHGASLLAVQHLGTTPAWLCSFDVSKGCYVRAIARDLGRDLGSAAHLADLRRTSAGRVTLTDCISLEELEYLGRRSLTDHMLDPVRILGLPVRALSVAECHDVFCGRPIPLGGVEHVLLGDGARVSVVADERLFGVWERSRGMLRCVVNFPGGIQGVRP